MFKRAEEALHERFGYFECTLVYGEIDGSYAVLRANKQPGRWMRDRSCYETPVPLAELTLTPRQQSRWGFARPRYFVHRFGDSAVHVPVTQSPGERAMGLMPPYGWAFSRELAAHFRPAAANRAEPRDELAHLRATLVHEGAHVAFGDQLPTMIEELPAFRSLYEKTVGKASDAVVLCAIDEAQSIRAELVCAEGSDATLLRSAWAESAADPEDEHYAGARLALQEGRELDGVAERIQELNRGKRRP